MYGSLKLTECQNGLAGKIVELATSDRKILGKLMSLGIVPGTTFCLLRRFPCYLLQVGHTKVALDRKLAQFICVNELTHRCRNIFL